MADGFVQVPPDSTGKKVDAASLDVGTSTVMRQRISIADNTGTATYALVTSAAAATTAGGLVTRNIPQGTQTVDGSIAISGTAVIAGIVSVSNNINVSAMPAVALAAGAANIGTINNISAAVVLGAGVSNIGIINNISAAVVIAAGSNNIGTINDISRTVQVQIATPFTVNNISATVAIKGDFSESAVDTSNPVKIGGVYNGATPPTYSAGQRVAAQFDSNGGLFVFLKLSQATGVDGVSNAALGRGVNAGVTAPLLPSNSNYVYNNASGAWDRQRGTSAAGTFVNLRDSAGTELGISASPLVVRMENYSLTAAVVLAAGTQNIGFINGISATVVTGMSYVVEKTTNSQVQVGDSANAAIRVNVVAGAAGGVSQVDGTSFDAQISAFVPMGGIFDDASSGTLSENDAGVVRLTTNRAMHVNLRTDGGVKLEDSANSALRVNIVAGAAGGVSQVDGTSFTSQAANFVPIGGIFDDASTDTLSENDAGVVRLTSTRAFHVNLRDAAGNEISAGNALSVKVERISATASVILAAGAANIGFINNISATVAVSGTVSLGASTANIGFINNISATVVVAGTVSLGASTANIGFINNISATVVVAGTVSLGASTANIGFINGISATISTVLAAGTANIGTLNNISATLSTVLAAGTANIGTINNISAAVVLAAGANNIGTINNISAAVVLAAGANNIGTINNISAAVVIAAGANNIGTINNISATVTVMLRAAAGLGPTASRGPRCITASTSANVTLVAAPGANLSIYVTQIGVSNAGAVGSRARVGTSNSTGAVTMFMASAGGGFVMTYEPPWQISANEALLCSVKPNTSDGLFNIHFYVAA